MPFYAKGDVRIRYEEAGSGFPLLVMLDDTPAYPYAVSMEIVHLAPHAEVTLYPWKEPKDLIPQAVHHVRDSGRSAPPVPWRQRMGGRSVCTLVYGSGS